MRQRRGQNIPMGGSILKEKAKSFAKELGIEFSATRRLHESNLLESSSNAFKDTGSIAYHQLACYLATLDLNTLSNLNIPFIFLELIGNKREFIFPRKTPKKISGKVPYRFVAVSLDLDMKSEKRHILLFLDNCTVYNNAPPLSNVKLKFSPPNSTSKLQPLDQGIIHSFKTFYRREIVKSVLDNLENQQNVTTISILTALIMIDKAWRTVTPLTIHSWFKKWHLGHCNQSYTPLYRGFDSFLGFYYAEGDYYTHTIEKSVQVWQELLDFHRNSYPTNQYKGVYTTEVMKMQLQNYYLNPIQIHLYFYIYLFKQSTVLYRYPRFMKTNIATSLTKKDEFLAFKRIYNQKKI
ncbi:tigger transposable element-derived protein 6 [Trichonephila clavipes]|nr:tigger transposable element-derived protein 6 [Trichonephila clavipes]